MCLSLFSLASLTSFSTDFLEETTGASSSISEATSAEDIGAPSLCRASTEKLLKAMLAQVTSDQEFTFTHLGGKDDIFLKYLQDLSTKNSFFTGLKFASEPESLEDSSVDLMVCENPAQHADPLPNLIKILNSLRVGGVAMFKGFDLFNLSFG